MFNTQESMDGKMKFYQLFCCFILTFITLSECVFVSHDGEIYRRHRLNNDWKSAGASQNLNLWDMVVDPSNCKDSLWNYFRENILLFRGEKGTDIFKETILASRPIILSTSTPAMVQVVVDVGARIGDNLKFLRTLSHPKSLYLGFEPNPVNWLRLNNTLQEYTNSKFFPYAVSREVGTASFTYVHDNKAGNPHGRLSKATSSETASVKVTTLDNVFEYFVNFEVEMLKVDTEGYDVTVLQGAKSVLPNTRLIIFESNMLMRASAGGPGTSLHEAQSLLKEYGFEVFQISANVLVPFSGKFYSDIADDPTYMSYHNCFAIRPSDPAFKTIVGSKLSSPACAFK